MKYTIFVLLLIVPLFANARIWTNKDGQKIDAEFSEMVDPDTVKIRMKRSGKRYDYPLKDLSEADQLYVKTLLENKLKEDAGSDINERRAQWTDNYEAALKEAKEFNIPILMLFTGSDWCGYCIKLEKNVFSKSEFKNYANKNLVLLKLDYPRKVSSKQREYNDDIAEKFGKGGYPTVHIVSNREKKLGTIGGYGGWPPKEYIEKIDKIK